MERAGLEEVERLGFGTWGGGQGDGAGETGKRTHMVDVGMGEEDRSMLAGVRFRRASWP